MAIPPHILQTCYRHVLQGVSNVTMDPEKRVNYSNFSLPAPFTFGYTFANFSMPANDYLQSLFDQGHHVVFAWEKQYRDLVVVSRVGGDYRILKAGMWPISNNYYTKIIWAEYMLVRESQQQWRYLCDIARFVLDQDLYVFAHTILRAPVILEEIWRRTCHPSVVERFIERCGGLEAYINGEEVSPVHMLRPVGEVLTA